MIDTTSALASFELALTVLTWALVAVSVLYPVRWVFNHVRG